jgi:hypothetical protein
MTSFVQLYLADRELFPVRDWKDRRKDEFNRLFAGIKVHLQTFSYKISGYAYETETTLYSATEQLATKCDLNYRPWFPVIYLVFFSHSTEL